MSDSTQTDQSQADSTQSTSATNQQQDSSTQAGTAPTEIKDLPDWAQKQIADLRREAANYRTKAQQFEDRDKSELQKAQEAAQRFEQAAKEAESRHLALLTEQAVRDAAAAAGAKNPKVVYRAIKDDLETDDEGQVTNLDAALKALKKESPELFGASQGSADGGRGRDGANGVTDMNTLVRQKAGITR